MTGLLDGRRAVVTGAASGIGFATAQAFAAQGARVVIADINGDAAEAATKRLTADGADASWVRCDVTSGDDVTGAVQHCVTTYGGIDVMVNNAGITRDATLRNMTLEDFRLVLDVHLVGTWLGVQAAGAVMREQKSGAIINVSSISGKVGLMGQTNYSAAKAGIVGLTKAAAKELARHNVRVNAIQPGLIKTPMTEAMRADIWESKMAEIPMGRAGDPSEVAAPIVFLASDLSSYITGTVTEITGGRYM
jgi:3-oxoacyl-[acyl-carrier protein] reductase